MLKDVFIAENDGYGYLLGSLKAGCRYIFLSLDFACGLKFEFEKLIIKASSIEVMNKIIY
jgi:hypothetical protein